MTLNWNYTKIWMEKSMPGYIDKVWTRFYGANVAPKRVAAIAAYLLIFCAYNSNPKVRYYASDMQLCGHTDASYLSVSKAQSRAAAYFWYDNHSQYVFLF